MAYSRTCVLLLPIVVASNFCILSVSSDPVHVSVLNRLGGGDSISIHCQSADTDLGPQTLASGGRYGWHFSVNVEGTTLFYCSLGWADVSQFQFSAYDYQRDRSRCSSNCSWIMADEGVYGLDDGTGLWEYMYSWSS